MTYYRDELLSSPRELIDYFLHDQWFKTDSSSHANLTGKGGMIFRGQSNALWPLSPSAFRPGRLNNFTPQPPPETMIQGYLRQQLGFQMHAEARAITLFLENADTLGIPTPVDYITATHGLDLILAALNDKDDFDYETTPFPPESFQRATALAQHHGVPTRFLDWSESPLVACYFAAYGASVFSQQPPDDEQEISVVFMSSSSLRAKDSPAQLIKAPRHENSHLLQQKGVFSSMSRANAFLLKHGRWPTLDDFSSSNFQIHRMRLKASQADDLLRQLFDLNITRHSLMPTLDNAANAYSYIQKLFKSLT